MIEVVTEHECVIVKPDTDIVAPMTEQLKTELEMIVGTGAAHLVVDLGNVEMIDSVGLGVLIAIHNKLTQNGGRLTVSNLTDDIYALFRTMRLNQHFEVLSEHHSHA